MKHLCLPASYAFLSEKEQRETVGGSEFRNAWNTFTDNLHFGDFVMGGGLLSFSISFVPLLLLNVVRTGYRVAEGIYDSFVARTGRSDETLTAFQNYTDAMRQKKEEKR